MKPITKLYDRLSHGERISLTVAAMARGDDRETDALRNTCQREIYSVIDWGTRTKCCSCTSWRLP